MRLHAVSDQIFSRRGYPAGIEPAGRNVIGGDASPSIASTRAPCKSRQAPAALTACCRNTAALDVRGIRIPLVNVAFAEPSSICQCASPSNTCAYCLLNISRVDGRRGRCFHFLRRGPDVAQKNGLAVVSLPSGSVVEIDIHAAGQRVGHHQRRRSQIIRAHQRIDAAFEIAIAAEHRDRHQVVVFDRLRQWRPAADRCCRCKWCSRSPPDGNSASRDTASALQPRDSR